ncbi:MAG: hypothetical protein ACOC3G_03580 [Phycisphaeraceae bacterium]
MAIETLTLDQAISRIGLRHDRTGVEYPRPGLQPYFEWLLASLELLADASAGDLRVVRDDASATSVRIMPGRASIAGVKLAFDGQVIDLAAYDDQTALLWLENDGGAAVDFTDSGGGWPSFAHIPLAEVTLAGGEITAVTDLRFETLFKV